MCIVVAEDHNASKLLADAMFAGLLQDGLRGEGKHLACQITGHFVGGGHKDFH
jgi:hypothetical protein